MSLYFLTGVLFVLGLYALVAKKNILKKVIGVVIIEYAVNLFLVLVGYRRGGTPPIIGDGGTAGMVASSVDPLPQALVLTSIVIGLGILILMVALCVRIYEKYGTTDMTRIRKLRG